MKTITRMLVFTALTLGVALPASQAADSTTPAPEANRSRFEQKREQRLKELDEKLHLTAEQKAKIEAIWAKAGEEGRDLRQADQQSRRERRKHQRELMKDTHAQVRAVLTPEQQKVFDAMPRPTARHGK